MKKFILKGTKQYYCHCVINKKTQEHRFFNKYMPDISTIPFYHALGIYTICEKVMDTSLSLTREVQEEETVLEAY